MEPTYVLRATTYLLGGTALTAVIGGSAVTDLGFKFIWRPVLLNAVLLVLLAVAINAPFKWRRYPVKN